jgi:hypothetical protein
MEARVKGGSTKVVENSVPVNSVTSAAANGSLTAANANAPATLLYRRKKGAKGEKAGRKGSYTRLNAVCAVLQANPTQDKVKAVQAADELFTSETGKGSNTPETYRRYRMAVTVLKAYGILQ